MIVELIGPPGAGKTTLLPTVIERFRGEGFRAYTAVQFARPLASRMVAGRLALRMTSPEWHHSVLWQIFYLLSLRYRVKFIALHPGLIWRVVNSQRRRPPTADVRRRKVSHWFFHHAGYYQLTKNCVQPDEVVVFDEGFLHRVVQLFSSSVENPNREQVAGYVDHLPRPDLTIFIQASPSVCERRVHERGVWERLSGWSQEEISQFLANAHLGVNLAVEYARRNGWRIVEIDNDSDDIRIAQSALQREISCRSSVVQPAVNLETV